MRKNVYLCKVKNIIIQNHIRMKKLLKILLVIIGIIISLLVLAFVVFMLWKNKMETNAGLKEDWSEANGTVITDLHYGNKEANTFDLYIPNEASKDQPQALILFIHGGSWMSGSKEEMEYACRRYAKEGYFTATMNYSLIRKDSNETSIPSMLDEINDCISEIKEYTNAKGYRIDRMSISGISAGGHLAMLYALKFGKESSIPIVFIAQRVGPTNLAKIFDISNETIDSLVADMKAKRNQEKKNELDKLIFSLAGKSLSSEMYTKEIIDSLLLTSSPISYVDSTSIPAVFAYGAKDSLVKPIQAQEIDSLYRIHQIPHKLFMFPNSNHFLGDDPEVSQKYINEVKEYCKKYFGY